MKISQKTGINLIVLGAITLILGIILHSILTPSTNSDALNTFLFIYYTYPDFPYGPITYNIYTAWRFSDDILYRAQIFNILGLILLVFSVIFLVTGSITIILSRIQKGQRT